MPTPPSPTTAIWPPGGTCAVFSTAPTPVTTAQPKIAASSSGTSSGILISAFCATTAYWANTDSPL